MSCRWILCRLKRALERCSAGRMATGAAMLIVSGSALAADVRFTAEFKPSVLTPEKRSFVNTTPISGYCTIFPAECGNGRFTVALPLGTIRFADLAPKASPRESVYFRFPSEYVDVAVRHVLTGEPATVRFRVSVYSSTYRIDGLNGVAGDALSAHSTLWEHGTRWVSAPDPCTYQGVATYGWDYYIFAWGTPPSTRGTPCVKRPARTIAATENFRLSDHSIAYELVTPSPFAMKNGVYKGTHVLLLGPQGDFDFGDKAIIARSSVELEFELTVEHQFLISMPDAAKRAVLEPPRGWTEWLAGGQAPTRLSRDLIFFLSLSAPLKVNLSCASSDGRQCHLENGLGDRVPYSVALSMPGIVTNDAQPVSRLEMTTGQSRWLGPANGFVANARSWIHVEAGEQSVAEMIKHPGSKYADVFTLTFDAQTD